MPVRAKEPVRLLGDGGGEAIAVGAAVGLGLSATILIPSGTIGAIAGAYFGAVAGITSAAPGSNGNAAILGIGAASGAFGGAFGGAIGGLRGAAIGATIAIVTANHAYCYFNLRKC